MEALAKNEVEVLKALRKLKEAKDVELAQETGLSIDGVRRGAYFLSEKGLAEIEAEESSTIELTEEGKLAREKLPEEEVLKHEGEAIAELPEHLRVYAGKLKAEGIITIEGGKIRVTGSIDNYSIKKALKDEDFSIAEKELLKRGYIRKKKQKTFIARITQKGESVEISEGGIENLTRELIESGEWKGKKFKSKNIAIENIRPMDSGYEHPLQRAIWKIKQIFMSMGFEEMTGNYVESSFWNFDALYQPQDHPSRELADTFFLGKELDPKAPKELIEKVREAHEQGWKYKWKMEEALKAVLRTHTTVLSARTLHEKKRGKFFAVGRVFRNEAIDYKHLAEFHQVEGIIAHEKANFRNLLAILKQFYSLMGFEEIRFRPSYFPYTEPSLEIEVWFEPKQEWVELGGAGMFRDELLEPLGVDVPVLAWGLSLERPLMMLMGLEDIRDFYTNKMEFLKKGEGF